MQYKDLGLDAVLGRYASEKGDPFQFAVHEARYRFAVKYLSESSIALDIGCAYGFGSVILADNAHRVYGVDDHVEVLRYAITNFGRPNLRYIAADCLKCSFPPESLDLITIFEVIEHLREPGPFLARCVAWLKPGGRLVLSTPNKLVHLLMGIQWEFHEREFGYSELQHLMLGCFQAERLEILGQNPKMIDHFREHRGRFKPYATPLRRVVWATVPRPVIRQLRRIFPKKPPNLDINDPTRREAAEITPKNADICDTLIAVGQVPV